MKQETVEHLKHVEAASAEARPLLAKHGYLDTLRNVLVIAFIDQVLEHHEAMILLVRAGKTGSAFSLARSIFESSLRGLWFGLCATDAQLQFFEQNDELPDDAAGKRMNMPKMAVAIDIVTGADPTDPADQFFKDLKDRGWKTLCSYTHSGLLQLGRRFTGHSLEPSYTDEEIVEITTSSTTCALLLIDRFLASHGHAAESKAAMALINTYGPLGPAV